MQAIRFAGPFGFLLSIPLLYGVAPMATLAVPLSLLVALLAMEQIGRARPPHRVESRSPRLLPALYIPLQLAVTGWAAWTAARPTSSTAAVVSLAISVGVCAGVFGMLVAHELIHSRSRGERRLGLPMLFAMSYPHFRIAHVYGHHRHAGTEQDASTARRGESFYGFLVRTIPVQLLQAWRFERQRNRGKRMVLLCNRVVRGALALAAMYGALLFWSSRAAGFMASESVVAILVLELFNYIAHYGLVRQFRDGTLEPLGPRHSWNSSGAGNLLIFNMGHHSRHHSAPSTAFGHLDPMRGARELPFGYAGAILLALVPPLWRRLMDRRIVPDTAERNTSGAAAGLTAVAMP